MSKVKKVRIIRIIHIFNKTLFVEFCLGGLGATGWRRTIAANRMNTAGVDEIVAFSSTDFSVFSFQETRRNEKILKIVVGLIKKREKNR